jgi:hypothetical protein
VRFDVVLGTPGWADVSAEPARRRRPKEGDLSTTLHREQKMARSRVALTRKIRRHRPGAPSRRFASSSEKEWTHDMGTRRQMVVAISRIYPCGCSSLPPMLFAFCLLRVLWYLLSVQALPTWEGLNPRSDFMNTLVPSATFMCVSRFQSTTSSQLLSFQ